MSLAEATEARKARLLALRKKKLGQEGGQGGEESQYVVFCSPGSLDRLTSPSRDSETVIKNRNFDPETRTMRKGGHNEEDTVELRGDIIAKDIVTNDALARQEGLASITFVLLKSE
jgi:coiled-coil domain-containing protein 12